MDVRAGPAMGDKRYEPPHAVKLCYFAMLGLWLAMPFLLGNVFAQDAVPFVVAGEISRTDPDGIYASHASSIYDLPLRFASRACEVAPSGTDCGAVSVAYVAPPQALVLSYPVSLAGPTIGVLVFRLVAAAALTGGMLALWNRLAHRTPNAAKILLGSILLLTPFFMVATSLGQTSPLMFLSAAMGVGMRHGSWRKALAVAAVLAATIVFKLFPIVLLAVLAWQRRWRLVGLVLLVLAVLSLLTIAISPTRLFAQFVDTTRTFSGFAPTNEHNGALSAIVKLVVPNLAASSGGRAVWLVAGLAVVAGGSTLLIRRRVDDDTQWAWSWLLLLFLVPMVWWHYLWVAVAAYGVSLGARRQLDDRGLVTLLALAAATIPPSLALSTSGQSLPVYQALLLIVATGAGWWLVPSSPTRSTPSLSGPPSTI